MKNFLFTTNDDTMLLEDYEYAHDDDWVAVNDYIDSYNDYVESYDFE